MGEAEGVIDFDGSSRCSSEDRIGFVSSVGDDTLVLVYAPACRFKFLPPNAISGASS